MGKHHTKPGRPFQKGHDRRRHKLTQAERQRGGFTRQRQVVDEFYRGILSPRDYVSTLAKLKKGA